MPTDPSKHVVEFTADEKALMASIDSIIKKIKDLDKAAEKPGKKVSGWSKAWKALDRDVSSFVPKTLRGVTSALYNVSAGFTAVGSAVTGSLIPAFLAIEAGFTEMSMGVRKALHISALTGQYNEMAKAVVEATNQTVRLSDALTFSKQAKSVGMTIDQIKKLSQIATSAAFTSAGRITEFDALQQLLEARTKGIVPEEIAKQSTRAYEAMNNALERAGKGLTRGQKGVIMINALLKEHQAILNETGNVLEKPWAKLLGFLQKISDMSESLTRVLKGLAMVVGGVLVPAGAGALAGFVAGGPIMGALGAIIGGLVSTALAAFGVNIIRQQAGDKQSVGEMIRARTQILSEFMAGGFGVLAEGKTRIKIPHDSLILQAFPEYAKRLSEISKKSDASASEIAKLNQKAFDDLVKPTLKQWAKVTSDVAMGTRRFSEGMMKGFKGVAPLLKDQLSELKKDLSVLGIGVDETFGFGITEADNKIFTLGETIAVLMGGLTSAIIVLTRTLVKTTTGVAALVEGLKHPFKSIGESFKMLFGFDDEPKPRPAPELKFMPAKERLDKEGIIGPPLPPVPAIPTEEPRSKPDPMERKRRHQELMRKLDDMNKSFENIIRKQVLSE